MPNEAALKQPKTPVTRSAQTREEATRAKQQGNLRLEVETAKEDGLFRGLGTNHDRSMRQTNENSKAESGIMWNQSKSALR